MMVEIKLLMLLIVANGAPVVAAYLCGRRFAYPLDGHLQGPDGRPLLGPAKTLRGILSALLATALAAPLLGLSWQWGAALGALAMCGDLFSSFIKRRLGMASSSMALGLDQVPESLLPLWACRHSFGLSWAGIAWTVVAFLALELLLSRLLYRFHIRNRPY